MPIQNRNRLEKLEEYLSESRNKTIFTLAVTIIFIILLILVGILPAVSSVSLQIKENGERDKVIALLEKKLSTIKSLDAEKESNKESYEFFSKIFPDIVDQELVIELIQKRSEENNLDLFNIDFTKDSSPILLQGEDASLIDPRVKDQGLIVNANGSQDELISFIKDLETAGIIINIKSLTLTKRSETEINRDPKGKTFNLSFQGVYYYFSNEVKL